MPLSTLLGFSLVLHLAVLGGACRLFYGSRSWCTGALLILVGLLTFRISLAFAHVYTGDLRLTLDPLTESFHLAVVGFLGAGLLIQRQSWHPPQSAWREAESQATQYRTLIEGSLQGICLHQDGRLCFVNLAMVRLFGYSNLQSLLGQPFAMLLAPQDAIRIAAYHNARLYGKAVPLHYEAQGRRQDGTLFGLETSVSLVWWQGRPAFMETMIDSTARKQTETSLEARLTQLQAVCAVAQEITRELDTTRLLQLIVQRAAELVDATSGSIHCWDDVAQCLTVQIQYGCGVWRSDDTLLCLGEGLVGMVAQQRQGFIVEQYQHSPYAIPEVAAHLGTAAFIAEPLLYHDRLVGVISLGRKAPDQPFTLEERDCLALFATQAAIALENARLFAEHAKQQTWLRSILEINTRLASSKHMGRLLGQIAEEAVRLVGADGALVCVRQGDRLVAPEDASCNLPPRVPFDIRLGEGLVGVAALEDRAIVSPNVQEEPEFKLLLAAHAVTLGPLGLAAIPIRGNGRVVGVLVVLARQPQLSRPVILATLSAYAEQAAIAIEGARLLTELQERTAMLEGTMASLQREVHDRKHAEETREQLIADLAARHTEMERFTYTVCHDLKSPLLTIQGFVDLLRRDLSAGKQASVQQDVEYIRIAAETMQALLDDMFELARIGRPMHVSQAVSLHEVVQQAVALVAGRMIARGAQIRIAAGLPVVWGDQGRLQQVFQNLLDNAVKFMGQQPEPQIDIGMRRDSTEVVLYVRDNGMGIDTRYHGKIFDLFEQLDPDSEGTGVGLALVKRIIEIHGGRIWIESDGPNTGSTFCFTLPQQGENMGVMHYAAP